MKKGILAILLAAAALLSAAGCRVKDPDSTASSTGTDASALQTDSTTLPSETSQPTEVSQPTEETTQPTETVATGMYTTEELMAMENECKGYGPGTATDGNRAPYADSTQAEYGQYGAYFIAPDDGCIYLTFDCGYEYSYQDEDGNTVRVTEQILDVLKEKGVKAVFFVTMPYCQSQPDLVQRMIDEGHIVGNHSNHHKSMPSLSIEEMEDEIMSLHTYVQENFGYTMTLFRPPMGEYSTRSLAVAQNLGYKSVFWSFAYYDYDTDNQPTYESALAKVTGCAHSGGLFLLHAVSTTNASILGEVIDTFRSMGYTIKQFS